MVSEGIFINGEKVTFNPENILTGDISTYTEQIGEAIQDWLDEHLEPGGSVPIDDTLTISGAAADAKKTGDEITALKEDLNNIFRTPGQTDADFYITDPNGNVIAEFRNGHVVTKNFDSANALTDSDLTAVEAEISELSRDISNVEGSINRLAETKSTSEQGADLYISDANGNVIAEFVNGHIITKKFDSSRTDQNAVKTVNNTLPDNNGNVNVRAELDPEEIQPAVDEYLTEHPVVAAAAGIVSVADYGAVGDGLTDDSAAIQNVVNSNYDVYFESNKTYYIASTIVINHSVRLHGGKNTVIKTKSVNGIGYTGVRIIGTQKLATTLTSDYLSDGASTNPNTGNRLSLASTDGVKIGDVIEIVATDQYYSYARRYYYLGGVFKVVDIYDGYVYIDRSMPWDITNTANVSVKVYDAPMAVIDNLEFKGDLDPWESGVYQSHALLSLQYCSESIIKNCGFSEFTIGLSVVHCVNSIIDAITLSKSKYNNTLVGDGYAITVNSSTNTVITRVLSLCSQACLDLTGTYPCIDTFISRCAVASESRAVGIGIHENSYNMVVEDCTIAGMNAYGTVTVNRCRFIANYRLDTYSDSAITIRGSHNPKWARFKISNCDFGKGNVNIRSLSYQDGIQPVDSVIDSIEIEDCINGSLINDLSINANVLSNTINSIRLTRWKSCREIYHKADNEIIKNLEISDCTFTHRLFIINDHNDAHGLVLDNIGYLDMRNVIPLTHKISVDRSTYGETFVLPENVSIELSSSNDAAQYVVCGNNLVSNNADDYIVGSVGGSVGSSLTRTKATGETAPTISIDGSGNLVYTQKANANAYGFYPVGMVYVSEPSFLRMSAILKNVGATSGASFRPYIAVVDCETGLVTYRGNGTLVTATTEGAEILHGCTVYKNSVVMCYFYCASPVSEAVTAFEDYSIKLTPNFAPATDSDEPYIAKRLTGDGAIKSLRGVNHIMSSESVFNVKFTADYVNSVSGII